MNEEELALFLRRHLSISVHAHPVANEQGKWLIEVKLLVKRPDKDGHWVASEDYDTLYTNN